jgi:16S rRNA (guanine527-N7)-methyltransferase
MSGSSSSRQAEEFRRALEESAPAYGVELDEPSAATLAQYYEKVMRWNVRLHLVAPCSPAEFATRHVLESLAALPFLAGGARAIDVGSGGGLPIIPCLVACAGLSATLIEASQKKAVFLREALRVVRAQARARVVAERFEQTEAPGAEFVTCRAIERFAEMLPTLLDWSPQYATLLLFAGPTLRERLEFLGQDYQQVQLPDSEQRFLFIIKKGRNSESEIDDRQAL